MMRKISKTFLWTFVLLTLIGCASIFRHYGTFVADEAVTKQFEAYQLDPDMNYYFHGSDVYPNVIMGLKKQYVLANTLWQPIKPDPEIFKGFIYSMQSKAQDGGQSQYGFIMKSPDGQTIGIWYSMMFVSMTVKMGEGNKVDVFTANKNVYDKDGPDK